MLDDKDITELKLLRQYFPFRCISGVKMQSGEFHAFACATFAKARNFARKHGGECFELK